MEADAVNIAEGSLYWAKSRRGYWVVKHKTAKDRLKRALSRIKDWCKANRHRPIHEQQQALSQQLRGHYGYYGVTGNSFWIAKFRSGVIRLWHKWLSRRSQRAQMEWEIFNRFLKRYPLPAPIAIHSVYRNAANPSIEEPDALIGHVRISEGPRGETSLVYSTILKEMAKSKEVRLVVNLVGRNK